MSVVAVVGAGAMGSGIAQVAAVAGERVQVYDARAGAARAGVEQVASRLQRQVDKQRMPAADATAATERLTAVDNLAELDAADLVVEAIVESLEVKRCVFADLEQVCRPETVLATNTSTLSVTDIAAALRHRGRVCGMHFFNPAPLMRLVEVPVGADTDPVVADRVSGWATAWGKTAVRCASTPGFIVNRVARPYYGEAQRIVEEGVAGPAAVDASMRAVGFRMGPFELADLIGNDVNLASATSVWEQTGHDPRYEPTVSQRRLVETGDLGRKSGRGWYDYPRPDSSAVGHREPPEQPQTDPRSDVSDRIVAMLVNEAAALVDRKEAGAADVDTAMRLGTNYPFGPLEHGDVWGPAAVLDVLASLHERFPTGRYRPADRLVRSAAHGTSLRADTPSP
ncbi:MAG TPA: 3-hydroxyacyl-CoA dehydrogenase NAD-binding domain-containing protein [Nocardioidaceae bacterium]|nr:3-hydroxyacyl-CoA dehydrogenase NAD-binding domain-containing protein [Nocardioidaceae bacterium]